jgi:5-deoxy-glucuronate isomerase
MDTNREPIRPETCVVRNTAAVKGRTLAVAPGRTATRFLHYGRIILDGGSKPLHFDVGERETAFIGLKGGATVKVEGKELAVGVYDALYVPRDSAVVVEPGRDGCDLAEIAAPVVKRYPLQHVKYADVQKEPTLHFKTGGPTSQRTLNILVGKNVEAGRVVAGVTFIEPGNWASWPPHEHSGMLEEAYLYVAMPEPAWGVQFVYTDPKNPELVVVVREGDCIVMPQGYHPNVASPGGSVGFLWMMAAHRETLDRQFGVVTVQPEYAAGGSGLEASRK